MKHNNVPITYKTGFHGRRNVYMDVYIQYNAFTAEKSEIAYNLTQAAGLAAR